MKEVSIEKAFKKFKPECCVFVISIDSNNKPSGMIAGWYMQCSRNPALVGVSLSKKGYTHKLVRQSREFVIAVPNKEIEKELVFFGSTHGNEVDKFKKTKLEISKAKFIKTPLIRKATVNFECKLEKEVKSGDHIIFIGKVLTAYINKEKKVLLNLGRVGVKHIFKEF